MSAFRTAAGFVVFAVLTMLVPLLVYAEEAKCDAASKTGGGTVTNDCKVCVTTVTGEKKWVGASCTVTGGGDKTSANCTANHGVAPGTCATKYCVGIKCFNAQVGNKPHLEDALGLKNEAALNNLQGLLSNPKSGASGVTEVKPDPTAGRLDSAFEQSPSLEKPADTASDSTGESLDKKLNELGMGLDPETKAAELQSALDKAAELRAQGRDVEVRLQPTQTGDWPGGSSPYLAAQREQLMSELDTNPALRDKVAAVLAKEIGPDGVGRQAVLEAMVNRAVQRGYTSLDQAIHDGFYGPVNRGEVEAYLNRGVTATDIAAANQAIEAVRGGSNLIDYRTDQGMRREVTGARVANFGGEWFGDMAGSQRWANEQRGLQTAYNANNPSVVVAQSNKGLAGSTFANNQSADLSVYNKNGVKVSSTLASSVPPPVPLPNPQRVSSVSSGGSSGRSRDTVLSGSPGVATYVPTDPASVPPVLRSGAGRQSGLTLNTAANIPTPVASPILSPPPRGPSTDITTTGGVPNILTSDYGRQPSANDNISQYPSLSPQPIPPILQGRPSGPDTSVTTQNGVPNILTSDYGRGTLSRLQSQVDRGLETIGQTWDAAQKQIKSAWNGLTRTPIADTGPSTELFDIKPRALGSADIETISPAPPGTALSDVPPRTAFSDVSPSEVVSRARSETVLGSSANIDPRYLGEGSVAPIQQAWFGRTSQPSARLLPIAAPPVGKADSPYGLWGTELPSVDERRGLYEQLASEGFVPPVSRYTGTEKQNWDLIQGLRAREQGASSGNLYAKAADYKGDSIVDFLDTAGAPSDPASRAQLAEQYVIENYDRSAAKNLELLSKLRAQASTPPLPVRKPASVPQTPANSVVDPALPPASSPASVPPTPVQKSTVVSSQPAANSVTDSTLSPAVQNQGPADNSGTAPAAELDKTPALPKPVPAIVPKPPPPPNAPAQATPQAPKPTSAKAAALAIVNQMNPKMSQQRFNQLKAQAVAQAKILAKEYPADLYAQAAPASIARLSLSDITKENISWIRSVIRDLGKR